MRFKQIRKKSIGFGAKMVPFLLKICHGYLPVCVFIEILATITMLILATITMLILATITMFILATTSITMLILATITMLIQQNSYYHHVDTTE